MQLVHISDDDKLAVSSVVAAIITPRAPAAHLRPSLVDAGCVYGQLRQAQYPHASALHITRRVVEGWYDGQPVAPPVTHIGDDDKIALSDASCGRIPDGDHGGLVDLGVQFGQRVQAGDSRPLAFYGAGSWLVQWYGGANPWEAPAPVHPSPLVGRLRLEGRVYKDDTGPVLPVFCHFMEAFSAFTRRPDDVCRQLDAIAAAGYHGVRFLDVLGYYEGGWYGREVTPFAFDSDGWLNDRRPRRVQPTPDYYAQLKAFLLACHARRLRVMHDRGDLNSWTGAMRLEHLGTVGAVYRELGDVGREVLAGLWAVNEAAHNGMHDPRDAVRMLEAFRQAAGWWPDVRGLSDYDQTEELPMLTAWSQDPATVVTIHPLRDPRNRKRMLEHHFSNGIGCRMIGKPGWATEPIGPGAGVTVGQENDAEMLAMLAAISVISGQAWTYMSSHGVFWNGALLERDGAYVASGALAADGAALRAMAHASQDWDFTKHQPGFLEVPQLIAKLPRDLHTYDHVHHSGTRHRGVRVFAIADDNHHDRADGAQHADGRFVYVLYSDRGHVPSLPVERKAQIKTLHSSPIATIVTGRVL